MSKFKVGDIIRFKLRSPSYTYRGKIIAVTESDYKLEHLVPISEKTTSFHNIKWIDKNYILSEESIWKNEIKELINENI